MDTPVELSTGEALQLLDNPFGGQMDPSDHFYDQGPPALPVPEVDARNPSPGTSLRELLLQEQELRRALDTLSTSHDWLTLDRATQERIADLLDKPVRYLVYRRTMVSTMLSEYRNKIQSEYTESDDQGPKVLHGPCFGSVGAPEQKAEHRLLT